MKTKYYITGLVAAMGLSLFAQPADAAFSDVKHYNEEIDFLTERDIIKGYDNGTFKPEKSVTRLQAIQMILRDMDVDTSDYEPADFTDMEEGDYGFAEVSKAVELGIISGKTDQATDTQYFDPYSGLSRGQLAKILTNAYDLEEEYNFFFTDIAHDHWAKDYVDTLASHGITTGFEDRTFRSNDPIKRSHYAVFLARMLNDDFVNHEEKLKYVSYIETMEEYEVVNESSISKREFMGYQEDGAQYWKTTTEYTDPDHEKYGQVEEYHIMLKETAEGLFSKYGYSDEQMMRPTNYYQMEIPYPLIPGTDFYTPNFDMRVMEIIDEIEIDGTIYHQVVYVRGNQWDFTGIIESYYAPNQGSVDGEYSFEYDI